MCIRDRKFLSVRNTVRQVVLKISAEVVIRLHRDNVRAVREQQKIVRRLQMVSARVVATGEEAYGLQPPGIGRVQNRDAIAEHMSDVKMPSVDHDLHAIRMSSDVAVRDMTDSPAEAASGHRRIFAETHRR